MFEIRNRTSRSICIIIVQMRTLPHFVPFFLFLRVWYLRYEHNLHPAYSVYYFVEIENNHLIFLWHYSFCFRYFGAPQHQILFFCYSKSEPKMSFKTLDRIWYCVFRSMQFVEQLLSILFSLLLLTIPVVVLNLIVKDTDFQK